MRKIEYIVIHHSLTPQFLDINVSVKSFSDNHLSRLGQPATYLDIPYKNCAYHYVISGDGDLMNTRGHGEVGYHAGSYMIDQNRNGNMNDVSIGICITGNFDVDKPSEKQMNKLVALLKELKASLGEVKVIGHREVIGVKKTCPGNNVDMNLIRELINDNSKDYDILSEDQIDVLLENHIFCYSMNAVNVLFSRAQKVAILYLLDKGDKIKAEDLALNTYTQMMIANNIRKVSR